MSAPTLAATRFFITGWSTVSPFGIGRDAFVEGLRERRPTAVTPDPQTWRVPDTTAHLVPDFSIPAELGKKGTRSMDRVTGLAVTAVKQLLAHSAQTGQAPTGEGAGLVLATAGGSVQSMMDFTRGGLESEKPYFVDPARFPNAVMNCAAGACAIWHQLKGPNATIAGGRASGLHALRYTQRLLRAERAHTVVCGGVEEYSNERSWLEYHTRGTEEEARALGEGCAVLQIEPHLGDDHDGPTPPEVLTIEFGVFGDEGPAEVLADCIQRAMDSAGVKPRDVWAVARSEAGGELGAQESRAVAQVCGDEHLDLTVPIGDVTGAAPIFQVVGAIVLAEQDPSASGRVAVITSVDRDGQAGCALLRLP
ncbi:MAG TPA: beta-ketoacyl synthase N-terminal-like domain-containing protein [Micromonospora sp.]